VSAVYLCHRRDRWIDGWTYGDWRQWICERPGGETQCARVILPLPFGWAIMKAVGPLNNGRLRVTPWDARTPVSNEEGRP
jgi:hypothetical protein